MRSRGRQGVGGHGVLREAHLVTCGWENGAREVGEPNTGIARDVQGLVWGVIAHEGAGAIRWVEPVAQRGEQVSARTAEDLEEHGLPGGPISCGGVFGEPQERAGRLGGNLV